MKKVLFFLMAMFICLSPAFAETTSHGPKPKGYNYSQNRRNNDRHYRQQIVTLRNTKGHVCSGHRYKRQR